MAEWCEPVASDLFKLEREKGSACRREAMKTLEIMLVFGESDKRYRCNIRNVVVCFTQS
jgi:hypothetical protein